MTIGGLIVAAVMLVISLIAKRRWLAKFTLGGVVVWFGLYGAMLIGCSLTSTERTLVFNEPKAFCGFYLDCHLQAAVHGVRTAKTLGSRTANGEYYIVNVKVFNDARRAVLGLLTVDAHVVDGVGKEYSRDISAESQNVPQPEFEKRVGPGEGFEKEIVFDLPANVPAPRLDICDGYGIDHVIEAVLVDDEDSVFHRRNYFDIREQKQAAGVK
jgi:hypothetical protein